jgi:hypothetical protein
LEQEDQVVEVILMEQQHLDLQDLLQFFHQLHQQEVVVEQEQVVTHLVVEDRVEEVDHLQDQLQEMQIQDLVIVHQQVHHKVIMEELELQEFAEHLEVEEQHL